MSGFLPAKITYKWQVQINALNGLLGWGKLFPSKLIPNEKKSNEGSITRANDLQGSPQKEEVCEESWALINYEKFAMEFGSTFFSVGSCGHD